MSHHAGLATARVDWFGVHPTELGPKEAEVKIIGCASSSRPWLPCTEGRGATRHICQWPICEAKGPPL